MESAGRGFGERDSRPRVGRHRRGALSRIAAAMSDWYRQPHDFDWLVNHRSTRTLQGVIRGVFAAATMGYAATSVLMLTSSLGPTGTVARAWVLGVLVVQVVVAAGWVLAPTPAHGYFIGFLVFGDVLTTSVLMLYEPIAALTGTVLFVVTGAFCTYFLSPRMLIAHLVWAATVILAFGGRTLLEVRSTENYLLDIPAVLSATLVLLIATIGVPVFAQVAWSRLSNDAKRSVLDPLTGVLNRRGIESELIDLVDEARIPGESVAFMVVDIDKFKSVNDRYGHSRGDEVIVRAADRLRCLVGDHGVLARTGGEEFLVAVTGDAYSIVDLGFRIVPALSVPSDDIPITVSVGVALVHHRSSLWTTGVSIVGRASRHADSAMYRSKESGGNRSVLVEL